MKTARPDFRPAPAELILASASAGRARVLRASGMTFRQQPAAVDERAIEARAGTLGAAHLAERLAQEKARAVGALSREALVLGADQVMECGGQILHKPVDRAAARAQLTLLRGQTHSLHSALALACAGEIVWRHVDSAQLTMRDFSDDFLDAYIEAEGDSLLASVGCYRIEGLGVQLFSRIEGDHFTIIGLPLIPLLDYLREHGLLPA